MSTSAIIALDDVLATVPQLNGLEGQRHIYDSFAADHRMVVITTLPSRDRVRTWLRQEHYRYDLLMTKEPTVALDDTAWKVQTVRDVRAMGWPVGFYLDCDPEAVRRIYADGVTSLLLAHRLVRPQWLPDAHQPRAWSDLVEFMDEQRQKEADPEPGVPRPWQQSVVR